MHSGKSFEDPTASAVTNSVSHQLKAQLGATKLMRIRRIAGHPPKLVSRPPVSSPSSSHPHQSPIAWIAKLDSMFGLGISYQGLDSMKVKLGCNSGNSSEDSIVIIAEFQFNNMDMYVSRINVFRRVGRVSALKGQYYDGSRAAHLRFGELSRWEHTLENASLDLIRKSYF
eukprot:1144512-Pelagomonas_calceolata.AAC.1